MGNLDIPWAQAKNKTKQNPVFSRPWIKGTAQQNRKLLDDTILQIWFQTTATKQVS